VKTIILIAYLVIGVVVAANKDYLGDVGGLSDIVNLLLAIVLWPLVLLGVDFNLKIGDDNGGNGNGGDKKNGALLMIGPALAYARSAFHGVPHAYHRPLNERFEILRGSLRRPVQVLLAHPTTRREVIAFHECL
jgi:hypothetical protein